MWPQPFVGQWTLCTMWMCHKIGFTPRQVRTVLVAHEENKNVGIHPSENRKLSYSLESRLRRPVDFCVWCLIQIHYTWRIFTTGTLTTSTFSQHLFSHSTVNMSFRLPWTPYRYQFSAECKSSWKHEIPRWCGWQSVIKEESMQFRFVLDCFNIGSILKMFHRRKVFAPLFTPHL